MTTTKTKTKTQTKCLKCPTYAIFLKSWLFTHSKYDDRYLTLVTLFTTVTLVTLATQFRSCNPFYRAECITWSTSQTWKHDNMISSWDTVFIYFILSLIDKQSLQWMRLFVAKKVMFAKKIGMGLATEDCRDVWGVRQLVNHVTKSSLKLHLCHDVNFSNCLACQKWPVSQTHWITKVTRLSSLFWLSWSLFCHCLRVGHINSRYPSDQLSERSKAPSETLKFLTAIWD